MDKISLLSDDLLIKILSLLETKDSVAMSILSKRWLSLWTLVPRLVFGDYIEDDRDDHEEDKGTNENPCKNLSQFVYGALLLHKAPVLECFHLNSASGCSASEIDLWVRIAVDRFVRDLNIRFRYEYGIIRFPSSLFRCETLDTLELRKVIFLEVPSQFSFRFLKTLRLLFIKYADEESFVRLVSNAPVLEDLVVETCHDDNVVTFTVNVPSLERLSIRNTLQDTGTENDLFVANLLSLSCHAKVLESFPRIKRLSLCLDEEARYPTGTVLVQLVRLELCLCESNWTNMLVSVLQHSPKLQVLKLVLNYLLTEDRKVCWIQPSCVPECLLVHLKTFEWSDYEGTNVEKQVAIYILKNAKRLVTATIYSDSVDLVCKHQMFEELEIATRGSRACELTMGMNI